MTKKPKKFKKISKKLKTSTWSSFCESQVQLEKLRKQDGYEKIETLFWFVMCDISHFIKEPVIKIVKKKLKNK